MKKRLFLIILAILTILLYLFFPRSSDKLVYIPKTNFISTLKGQNIPLNIIDIYFLKFLEPKSGWVRVDENTNKFKLIYQIIHNKREKTRKMVMFEGETIKDFIKTIAKQANLDKNRLLKIYYQLAPYKEASILAGKYDIPYNTTEYSTIFYMINKSTDFYKNFAKKHNIKFPSSEFKKYLIIASILEKETANYDEMPLISAVIHNRLKKGMKLQIDATLNYGKYSHRIITSKVIKKDNSKFNTYKFKGLPPEPIASVSKTALNAAFNPADVDYLYFVKKPDGKHYFSSHYSKHLKGVKKYKNNLRKLKKLYSLMAKPINLKLPMPIRKIYLPTIHIKHSTLHSSK